MKMKDTSGNEEALKGDPSFFLTVGQLLDFIEKFNIPRDSKVLYQRIEDHYFDKSWKVVKKEGFGFCSMSKVNEDIDLGNTSFGKKYSEEALEKSKEQYIPAFSPVKYKGDDNLYIDSHY